MCCRFVYAYSMYLFAVGVCFVHIRNSSVSRADDAAAAAADAHIYGNYHIEKFAIK